MIELTLENNIAQVTLNRPEKLNAMNMAVFKALDETLIKLQKNKKLRAVILSGNGTDFCSGIDVKSIMHSKLDVLKLLWKIRLGKPNLAQRIVVGWRKLPVPVIAALHGRCWGAGMQLALGADFRIAHPETSLSIMESKWGLIPDMGGTLALRENVSLDRAMQLAMTAKEISAQQALELNLITDITLAPIQAAREMAESLASKSPTAIAEIKKLFHRSYAQNEKAILRRETLGQLKALMRFKQK